MDGDMDTRQRTVVEDQGLCLSPCGYCKSNVQTSATYGLWARSLSVNDYEELLNQTWRRSGMFLYRPEMDKTCCPAYTIRLNVNLFSKSKEHTRVMRRMQRYLDGTYTGHRLYKDTQNNEQTMVLDQLSNGQKEMGGSSNNVTVDIIVQELSTMIEEAIKDCRQCGEYPRNLEIPKIAVQRILPSIRKRIMGSDGELCYTCNVAFRCAAAVLKQKPVDNCAAYVCKQYNEDPSSLIQGALSSAMAQSIASRVQKHDRLKGFTVEACKGHLNFIYANNAVASRFSCQEKQMALDNQGDFNLYLMKSSSQAGSSQSREDCSKHKLEIHLTRSCFDPEEFALYKRYQTSIHHEKPEDVTEAIYQRFLVDTPLSFVPPDPEGSPSCGYGSFHQRYLIDGHLVAVGVVDILPSCFSSNYFFWDPDLEYLSLGKYSALQEIAWVQEANKYCPNMSYYFLGHYIHSCPKMHYKVSFRPSELLCPVKFKWVPFDVVQPFLEKQPYLCLSDCVSATPPMEESTKEHSNTKQRPAELFNEIQAASDLNRIPLKAQAIMGAQDLGDVSVALLKLGDLYVRLKDLQAWNAVPQDSMDMLVSNLRNYTKNVGLTLAGRMAYALD